PPAPVPPRAGAGRARADLRLTDRVIRRPRPAHGPPHAARAGGIARPPVDARRITLLTDAARSPTMPLSEEDRMTKLRLRRWRRPSIVAWVVTPGLTSGSVVQTSATR